MGNITHTLLQENKGMKNKMHYLILAILVSCTETRENRTFNLYESNPCNKIVHTRLELKEANELLCSILDTIILKVVSCPKYKNKQMNFILTTELDSLNRELIRIDTNTDIYDFNYSECNGVFYYQGYQFACLGNETSLLKKTKKTKKIFYQSCDNWYQISKPEGEFFDSYWQFLYENNVLKCTYYFDCDKYWQYTPGGVVTECKSESSSNKKRQ